MTKSNVKKEFGAAVRAHRLRLGFSQETLAERAQLHRTYVTDVERGARNISLDSISRLAGALDLSISSLFSAAASGEKTEPLPQGGEQNVDILLVEDDPADIELALSAFKTARLSNRIEVVQDGSEALDFLLQKGRYASRKLSKGPLVVLLDLHLPKMHGLEVLQRLRGENLTRTISVVILTNSRQDADVRQALRLGAQAYVVKPLNFRSLSLVTPQLNFSWALLNPAIQAPRPARSAEQA
jgi:CheY-like chemotaxis protein/DNA-binding XRE family transcriptional regulator